MPMYVWDCPECGRVEGVQPIESMHTCVECGGNADHKWPDTVSGQGSQTPFEPYFDDMMDSKPIYIDSAATLDREAKKRGLTVTKEASAPPEYARKKSANSAPTKQMRKAWLHDAAGGKPIG